MKKWQIHQPSEEAAKQIRSSSDLSMLCAQVLAARGMHNVCLLYTSPSPRDCS